MSRWREGFKQVRNYPSAVFGLALIAFLMGIAVFTVVFLSFDEAESHWRDREPVKFNPSNAQPSWINAFGYDLPSTIKLHGEDGTREREDDNLRIEMEFEYTYSTFPSEMTVFFDATFEESAPFARLRWHTPDERMISLGSHRVGQSERILISQDRRLERRFEGEYPHIGLLSDPANELKAFAFEEILADIGEIAGWVADEQSESRIAERLIDRYHLSEQEAGYVIEEIRARLAAGVREAEQLQRYFDNAIEQWRDAPPEVLPGTYRVEILVDLMEEDSDVTATYVCFGRVHGIAGTDHRRRDLLVALLWGTPVALAFGLLAAVGTTITTLIIAAIGVWFGGLIDAAIQRVTEVNMILPLLPILVMIGTLYSQSIWVMLGVVILLGIFSAGIKMYRAMLLPIREAPYIEAARAYGAGNLRIVFRYMIPRILPVLIPSFVTLIPTFVFLEASLAVLGLGDPVLPTWGKVLHDAQEQGALYNGFYYWVLAPAIMLMVTGLGFAMFGFALDRIFNPRLRQV